MPQFLDWRLLVATLILGGSITAQQPTADPNRAVRTLDRYIHLRLGDAGWQQYSKLITWPDEPGWDCRWVTSEYSLGTPSGGKHDIVVPVIYSRLGLFCYDFDFKPKPEQVTIRYKLVRRPDGWKVESPVPDYPDISERVLLKSLQEEEDNGPAERRADAAETVQKIKEAVKP